MTVLNDRDELSRLCKDAFYAARDGGRTMHQAADDAADRILSSEWRVEDVAAAEQRARAEFEAKMQALADRLTRYADLRAQQVMEPPGDDDYNRGLRRAVHDLTAALSDAATPEAGPAAPADQPAVDRGRRLASERDDLITQGVDPAELEVPLYPREGGRP